jgi:hypothetical protein
MERGNKYQYGNFSSVEIFLSSNAQQKPFWRGHDLTNCRAVRKMTTNGVRQFFFGG